MSIRTTAEGIDRYHWVAVGAWFLLTLTYVGILYQAASVVGISQAFVLVTLGTMIVAASIARLVTIRMAGAIGSTILAAGCLWYLIAIPEGIGSIVASGLFIWDISELLTGLSILHITAVDAWILAVIPAPIFISTVLIVKGRYLPSAMVGASALGILILTGDAGYLATLVGVLGLAGTITIGELRQLPDARAEGTIASPQRTNRSSIPGIDRREFLDTALLGLSGVVLGTVGFRSFSRSMTSESAGGGFGPIDRSSLDEAVVGVNEEMPILGSVNLSPTVRFTMWSEEAGYWRVDGYDRYTGSGWIRTGGSDPLAEDFGDPIGPTTAVKQAVRTEDRVLELPGLWEPTALDVDEDLEVSITREQGLVPAEPLEPGFEYAITSHRPTPEPADLRRGGEYPDSIRDRYTQLPDGISDRVVEYTASVVEDAESRLEVVQRIESHLKNSKGYSLDVERPRGEIVDGFLFEMETGYCTYFATAMVVMLRLVGIPARMATGYSSGERVEDGTWVVRGLNAHAWVEVFFPTTGWIAFEPTPRDARDTIHDDRLGRARAAAEPDIETPESEAARFDDELGTETESDRNETDGEDDTTLEIEPFDPEVLDPIETDGESDSRSIVGMGRRLLSRVQHTDPSAVGLGIALALGGFVGARRLGTVDRIQGPVRDRFSTDNTPAETAKRSYERLERSLATAHRPRKPGETHRSYVMKHVDPADRDTARTIVTIYERVEYGNGIDADDAAVVADAVDSVLE